MTRTHSVGALAIGIPLLLAACGGQGANVPASSPSASASGNVSTRLLSPQQGTVVTANSLEVKVAASGYQLSCALAGKPNKAGFGHYHIELDHALVNMYCGDAATFSLQNVSRGQHTLTVLPALNDHRGDRLRQAGDNCYLSAGITSASHHCRQPWYPFHQDSVATQR